MRDSGYSFKSIAAAVFINMCLLAASPAAGQTTEPRAGRKSEAATVQLAVKKESPEYPPLARIAGIEGPVVVEVQIDEQGVPTSARAAAGPDALKDASIEAALKWRWSPAMLSGVPVKVIGTLTFSFVADGGAAASAERIKNIEAQIEGIKQEIAANPDSYDLYSQLGEMYEAIGRDTEAAEAYTKALQIEPGSAKTLYKMGRSYLKLRRVDESIERLKDAARQMPGFAEAHFTLGRAYTTAERYQDAVSSLKQATAIKPDWGQALYLRGLIHLMKLKDKEAALEDYNLLRGVDPKLAESLLTSIRAH